MPKKILICVTGGIAAYKTLELIRILAEKNFTIQVAMSKAAQKFISPLSFETLSQNKVARSLFEFSNNAEIEHIHLAQSFDIVVVAPATANIIAKFACGIADDLISTILLASNLPLIFVPAMNCEMWQKKILQKNIQEIQKQGAVVLEPQEGSLACGSYGLGKMQEPKFIADFIYNYFSSKKNFAGKKILISLGATREYLDPFRFISNASSGKMGLELANLFLEQGAEVFLVCGDIRISIPSIFDYQKVLTTEEMKEKMLSLAPNYDCIVMCAAVSDYQSQNLGKEKIKQDNWQVTFKKTTDILAKLGENKKRGQLLVGFAAESHHLESYAKEKMKSKNLDLICANKIGTKDSGFESDNSEYQIFSRLETTELKKSSKKEASAILVQSIEKLMRPLN